VPLGAATPHPDRIVLARRSVRCVRPPADYGRRRWAVKLAEWLSVWRATPVQRLPGHFYETQSQPPRAAGAGLTRQGERPHEVGGLGSWPNWLRNAWREWPPPG